MYIVGIVLTVASLWGLSDANCRADVFPSNGIADGVDIGQSVEIDCNCGVPSGTWSFNGSEISSSGDSVPRVTFSAYTLGYTLLVIPNFSPQYAGNYTCAVDDDSVKPTVVELSTPNYFFGPPIGVQSEGVTDEFSVTISWTSATTNSSQLNHYRVTLVWTQPVVFNTPSTLSDTNSKVIPINNRENFYTHTFRNILPYSNNCITVEAIYSQEDTVLATIVAPTQCFTSSSSAPTAPIDFHLVHLGQTSITASWNSPIFPNGPITYYILYVNGQPLTIPVMGFQSPYSHELGGQQPNTTYDLSVSAVTDFIKEGPKSDSITVTTLALEFITLSIAVVYETTQDCQEIMENSQSYKETLMSIYNNTVEDIKQQCSCTLTIGLDYDTQLRCTSENDKAIIFETRAYASNDTITLLEQSVAELLYNRSTNIIIVNGNTLRLTGSVCSERTASNITCANMLLPPNNNGSDDKSDHDSTGVVVGVIVAALVIIILITVAAVILMIMYYKKRHSYQLTGKTAESQVTGVSVRFHRRSRFSWSLPAILNTWRSSNNQTAPQPARGKNSAEEVNDYSFPLPLADKNATLKDSQIGGNRTINGILQHEEQPTIYEAEESDELDETKKTTEVNVKPEMKSKIDSCSVSKSDNSKPETKSKIDTSSTAKSNVDNVAQKAKQRNTDVKPVPKFKENLTMSYSIPIDYKWDSDKPDKQNSLSVKDKPTTDQKHISPIYIEMDDVRYKDDVSENDSESNVYSVPVDSISDSDKISESKHTCSPTRGKQAAKITSSLPIIKGTLKSNCKPHGITGDRDDDDTYSAPIDDISSTTRSCENINDRTYTSPINSPIAISLNPSYKQVYKSDPSITEYSDPVTTLSKGDNSEDNPFAAAVANIQLIKKHKHKPAKPNPYKPKQTFTTPRQEDPPLYEEIFQTSATLPYNNGLYHNLPPASPLSRVKKIANSQTSIDVDDYTVPGTHKLKIHKNPSYGDFCDTSEASDYTYVPTNRLIAPNVLEDACTTHTDC